VNRRDVLKSIGATIIATSVPVALVIPVAASPNFHEFMAAMLRQISAPMNVPYEMLAADYRGIEAGGGLS